MRMIVCFGSTKVVVPCKEVKYVKDLFQPAIDRFKKVTKKVPAPAVSWRRTSNLNVAVEKDSRRNRRDRSAHQFPEHFNIVNDLFNNGQDDIKYTPILKN